MNKKVFAYKLRAMADVIDTAQLARGAVNLFTFHKPQPKTLEGLYKLRPGNVIDAMELIQVINGEGKSEVDMRVFEVMAFFPDVMHRGTVYHLLLKDMQLLGEGIQEEEKQSGPGLNAYSGWKLSEVPLEKIQIGTQVIAADGKEGKIAIIETPRPGSIFYTVTIRRDEGGSVVSSQNLLGDIRVM
jgi:hypothetical protein